DWLGAMIKLSYTTEMGLESGEQSALNLLTLIGTKKGQFRIYGASDERYHVRGGNDLIAQSLGARVADAIELNSMLEAVRPAGNGELRVTIRQGAASREFRAAHVVLAIPLTTLRDVKLNLPLPVAKQRAIQEIRYGTNAKLMIGFAERIWRT